MSPKRREQPGDRIRRYREEKGLTLTELANAAHISKGYISNLENNPDDKRPSAASLYAIAKALGVTMSDLLGERLIVDPPRDVPESLKKFASDERLPEADIQMLASIEFRGDRPRTPARWRHIYDAIRMSTTLDERQRGN